MEDSLTSLACTENIALLSLLSEVPSDPLVNQPDSRISARTYGRALSFRRKLRLSNSIALISGVSDDPNHVVAICLEEFPDQAGIRILVAINKEKHASGDKVLHRIKHGLEKIFSLLPRSTNGMSGLLPTTSMADKTTLKGTMFLKRRFLMQLLKCAESASSLELDIGDANRFLPVPCNMSWMR